MPPRIAGDSRRQTLKYDALTNDEFVADPVCGPPPSAFSCFWIAFARIVRVSWCFSSSCLRASALSQHLVGRRLCQPQVGGFNFPLGALTSGRSLHARGCDRCPRLRPTTPRAAPSSRAIGPSPTWLPRWGLPSALLPA